MTDRNDKILYWTPRVLSIMFIIFLSLFSLDIFEMKLNFWDTVIGLFMHNIPGIIMTIILIISWKHEIVGAVAFIGVGLLYTFLTIAEGIPWYMAISWGLTISGPAFLIGVLFLIGWRRKIKKNSDKSDE